MSQCLPRSTGMRLDSWSAAGPPQDTTGGHGLVEGELNQNHKRVSWAGYIRLPDPDWCSCDIKLHIVYLNNGLHSLSS